MSATKTIQKPLSVNVSIWRYIFWLGSQDENKLTKSQKAHKAFWDSELGIKI